VTGGADGDADTAAELAASRGIDDDVYPPSEDSGLLAAAADEVDGVRGTVVEVGTGSGWVAERVAAAAGVDRVVGTDVNPHAVREARERGIGAVRGSLLDPVADGAADAVLFNPPYLPTDPDAAWDDWMERALSGGESGRALIAPFLADLDRALAPGGVGLLLVSSLTGFEAVTDLIADAGFESDPVRRESYPFETLSVLALRRE